MVLIDDGFMRKWGSEGGGEVMAARRIYGLLGSGGDRLAPQAEINRLVGKSWQLGGSMACWEVEGIG